MTGRRLVLAVATRAGAMGMALLLAVPLARGAPAGDEHPANPKDPDKPSAAARPRPVAPAKPARRAARKVHRSPAETLVAANNHYSYGRYESVVRLLRPIVERGLLRGRADRLEALRLYGICLYLTGRKSVAGQVFRTLILKAPQTRLDPRLVQPEVVAAFEKVRRPHLEKLRKQALRVRNGARRKLRRRWSVLNLIPTAGQFQNGHWKKGLVLISLEVTLLAANLLSAYLLSSNGLRQPDRTFVEKDADGNVVSDRRSLARALMGINYASFGLLIGTLIYGVIDGFVYDSREKRRLRRMVEQPLVLTPMSVPDGMGLALTLEF